MTPRTSKTRRLPGAGAIRRRFLARRGRRPAAGAVPSASGVPAADPTRRRWSRLAPVALAMVAIIATLAVILILNVRISDGQYRLVELRSQERSLAQEAEALTQDLEFYEAPQNLAVAAGNEGMVTSDSEGVIDLTNDEITGDPQPAGEREDSEILVAQPVQRGSAAADRAAAIARERRDALPQTQSEVEDQLRAANAAEGDVDLHGGSIPAPQQRPPADATPSPSPTEMPTDPPADADAPAADPGTDPAAGADDAEADQPAADAGQDTQENPGGGQ